MPRADDTNKRISLLQDWLRAHQLAGVFVPRTDFWQGEEVMACDERLAWLTGFSGSVGLALIMQDRAGLFIDGRYTLQAATETEGTTLEPCHFMDRPWQDWIGDITGAYAIDPKLVTSAWVQRATGLLSAKGSTLEKLDVNPIDTMWIDQPAPRFTAVEIFPLELAGEVSLSKRNRLGQDLKGRGFDGAFITDPTGIAWLLNIRAQDYAHTPVALSVLWLQADGTAMWFTDEKRVSAEVLAHIGDGVDILQPLHFAQQAEEWADKTVLLDEMTAADWLAHKLAGAGAKVKFDRCITALPKACKNKTEVEGMRAAHRRDGLALVNFLDWFATEVAGGNSQHTETAVMAQLDESRRGANEYRGASFSTICGFAGSGAIVHYRTTPESDTVVSGNSLLLLDSGGQYVDGTTDITRTLAVGTPTPTQIRDYTLVLKGHIGLARARFPVGTTGHQLDALARAPLWAEGLNYDHGTGHGVGHYLSVHEGPQTISFRAVGVPLRPGMVISNEPGCYVTGEYGIRIETLVTVKESDKAGFLEFETLTRVPYERSLIDASLLTPDERTWLDSYHADLWDEMQDKVQGKARDWLRSATKPL